MDMPIHTEMPARTDARTGSGKGTHRPARIVKKATHQALLRENRALRETVDFLAMALCGVTYCAVRGREQEYYNYVARHLPEGSGIRDTLRRQIILRNCLPGEPGENFTFRQYLSSGNHVGRFVDKAQEWCDSNVEDENGAPS